MQTLNYPSGQFPGPPAVAVDIPEGWSPVRVPGTLLAARRTSTDGSFAPNVVVRGFTRSGRFTIGRALAELQASSTEQPDGEMEPPFEARDRRRALRRGQRLVDRRGGRRRRAGPPVRRRPPRPGRRPHPGDGLGRAASRSRRVRSRPAADADRPGHPVNPAAPAQGAGLTVRAGAATDVGRVRQHNEDSLLADRTVFVVADGMGGHAAGEVASRIVTETLGELAERPRLRPRGPRRRPRPGQPPHPRVGRPPPRADRHGHHRDRAGRRVTAGGSDHWAVFNVGDSRVYRFLDGQLRLVTVDHSEVRELIDAGLITEEEAAAPPAAQRRHPLARVRSHCRPLTSGSSRRTPASASSSAPTACPTSCARPDSATSSPSRRRPRRPAPRPSSRRPSTPAAATT